MFRVPQDTVLRRAAATSLLVLSTGLAACGSDGNGDTTAIGSSPAVVAATTSVPSTEPEPVDPTTPGTTPLTKKQLRQQAKQAAADQAAMEAEAVKKVSKNLPQVTDSPETDQTVAEASAKKKSKSTIQDDMKAAQAALKKAGQQSNVVQVTGGADGAIQIKNTTVVFFASNKKAATSAKTFALALAANPKFGKIDRTDNRVYLVNTAQALQPSDVDAFNEVRKIVDAAL